jgi:hypothetical protein
VQQWQPVAPLRGGGETQQFDRLHVIQQRG